MGPKLVSVRWLPWLLELDEFVNRECVVHMYDVIELSPGALILIEPQATRGQSSSYAGLPQAPAQQQEGRWEAALLGAQLCSV